MIAALPWIAAVAAALVLGFGPAATRPVAGVAFISALLLAGIDRLEPRLGWPAARVMSDLALLTPVVGLAAT
jgi:hypothetical protein